MVQIPLKQGGEAGLFQTGKLPALLYAGQISEEPDWFFPSHKHDDLSEIIYISEGEGRFTIGNDTYTAGKGDILIYNRGVLHEEWSNPERPLKTYFCGIGDLRLTGVGEGCILPADAVPLIPTGPYSRQVEGYLSTLFEELRSQVFGFETICRNVAMLLIVSILRIRNTLREEGREQPGQPHQARTVRNDSLGYRIKEFIDINYTRDIPLGEIANRLYISPYYLSHIFKEETGYSPINYMIQRRIGEAKKLLLTTQLTVQEIAERVGYPNPNYFSTLFRKAAGCSPSEFRKLHLMND